MKFDEALEGYWLAKRLQLSHATVDGYTGVFKRFQRYLAANGNPEFEQITANHIRAFLNDMADHGKGDKGRNVYPGQAARSALWKYLQERQTARRAEMGDPTLHPHEPLFATNTNAHLTRDNLLHTIQRIAQRASISHANLHRFRHTFAINFLRNGGNVYALQDLLGHADLETVRIYLKVVDQDLRAAMNAASPADTWRL